MIRLLNERQLQSEDSLQDEDAMVDESGDDHDDKISAAEQETNVGDAEDSRSDSSGTVAVGSEEEIDEDELSDIEQNELADLQDVVPYPRLMCIAHTLQLVIKKAYCHYDNRLMKVRRLIGKIKKSSVAVGKLKKKTGKVLLCDNSTRWNSTYHIAQRLIVVKDDMNLILTELKVD
jgi:hypothetical protein